MLAILAGLMYTYAIIVWRGPIAATLGVMDHPGSQGHKAHKASTPLVGGVACLPPAILVAALSANTSTFPPSDRGALIWMAIAVSLSAIVGLIDDRKHIPAPIRLLVCGSVFSFTLFFHHDFIVDAVSFDNLDLRFILSGSFAIVFSTFCLLMFQNSVNMADGRNGLVLGLSIIWSATLLMQGRHPTNLTLFVLLAGLVLVMFANVRGKLFLGDAGTYGIGALIGLATIWVHRSAIGLTSSQVISMFLIPMIDMIRLFFFRLSRRRSPFKADHHHLHHYLDQEFGWNRGLVIYLTMVTVPIVVAEINDVWGIWADIVGIVLYGSVILYTRRLSPRTRQ